MPPDTLYTIYDRDGPVLIDSDYRDLGIAEGWLVVNRVYHNADNLIVEYKHVPSHPP